jgi:hypothetical protein
MNEVLRKKSPRAPSAALDESLERALRIYDRERRHPTPTDVIAQNLGYKSANNGSALSAIASLRSYGFLERVQEGKLAVSKDVEVYRFAPTDELRSQLRVKWLKAPSVFGELLEKYAEGLPSEVALRFDLIQRGFTPASAESTLAVFKKSVEFAGFFDQRPVVVHQGEVSSLPEADKNPSTPTEKAQSATGQPDTTIAPRAAPDGYDRIPVRLFGGRRAWLEIPTPFYEADKKRLIAQIELVLTQDDEANSTAS